MAKSKDNAIPEHLIEEAKTLFMDNVSVAEIARHLGIKRTSLQYYQNKDGWKAEREELHIEEFSEFMSTRQSAVTRVTRDALSVMERGLAYLSQRTAPPTIDEVNKAAKAMEVLSKMSKESVKKDPIESFEASFESQGALQEETIKSDESKKKSPKKKKEVKNVNKDPFGA